jgi:outer membrane protein OmpA-like peptidoglycan-associated protein
MEADPNAKLRIDSYADEQGSNSSYDNQKLTDKRAKTVRQALIKGYGIDPNRIVEAIGHGAVKGQSVDYMPNRRSDICFVK